jgi:hypothetical protein
MWFFIYFLDPLVPHNFFVWCSPFNHIDFVRLSTILRDMPPRMIYLHDLGIYSITINSPVSLSFLIRCPTFTLRYIWLRWSIVVLVLAINIPVLIIDLGYISTTTCFSIVVRRYILIIKSLLRLCCLNSTLYIDWCLALLLINSIINLTRAGFSTIRRTIKWTTAYLIILFTSRWCLRLLDLLRQLRRVIVIHGPLVINTLL